MAMDIRLVKANDDLATIAFDFGTDSKEFQEAHEEWLETFKVVAAERGEPVIEWENPYDHIMDVIDDYKSAATIEKAISAFKQMVDALESINYGDIGKWKDNYNECVVAWNAVQKKE